MQIFKNISTYRFTEKAPSFKELAEAANAVSFTDASSGTQVTSWGGFVPVLNNTEELALPLDRWTFIKLQIESRILPPAAIKDAVDEKVRDIEEREGRKVYRREKQDIKDSVLEFMIPRAFTQKKHTQAVIDHDQNLIYIDASSENDAANVLNALRGTLGSLPVRPLSAKMSLRIMASSWIKAGNAPEGLALGERCTLTGNDSERVQVTNSPIWSDEVRAHLGAGLAPEAIELEAREAGETVASFVLHKDLSLKRFCLSHELLHKNDDYEAEHEHDQVLSSMVLMMHALGYCRRTITEALGGEELPEQ